MEGLQRLIAACLLSAASFLAAPPAPTTQAPAKTTAKAPAKAPAKAAAKKGRPARKTAPISAKTRQAASERVSEALNTPPSAPIERAGALVPFYAFLSRQTEANAASGLHILHFGDSHTAADLWTKELRTSFQEQFGDGGPGFSFPGRPFLGYRRFDLQGGASRRWQSEGLRAADGDGLFGLGGLSISTRYASQSVYIVANCEYLEVFYLQQPGGGRIALYEDGERVQQISTDGELGPGYLAYQTSRSLHRFEIRTLESAPVRLFGWVTEKQPGVTYESMGLNGAEATWMLRWNEAFLASYIGRRDPKLIVLAFGTNEASDPQLTPENYRTSLCELLERLRRAAPLASILMVGPPDRFTRVRGIWTPLEKVDAIIEAQRLACESMGCAFWDTRARMGGKGSMRDWVYSGMAQADYAHFTADGYRRLGVALYQDVIQGYQVYQQARLGDAPSAK